MNDRILFTACQKYETSEFKEHRGLLKESNLFLLHVMTGLQYTIRLKNQITILKEKSTPSSKYLSQRTCKNRKMKRWICRA